MLAVPAGDRRSHRRASGRPMRRVGVVVLAWLLASADPTSAVALEADAEAKELIQKVVATAGGEVKLLKLFRIKERLNVSPDPTRKGNERTSVLEPPDYWWLGKVERVKETKEPAVFLAWAWTLRPLLDPESKIEVIPDVVEENRPAAGLRVSGTITPAMDLYFDKVESRLVRIDWRGHVHRFSQWNEYDGLKYPAKCVGYNPSGKPWYFSEIIEIERLSKRPEEPAQ
jgi:hypothetical protein